MKTIQSSFWSLFLLLVLISSCESGDKITSAIDHFEVDRPHNPWVFRSVLDVKPRMITLALHDDMWVAYSADSGAMYKAWRGGVNFDGAVYTTAHGPQPTSIGDGWFINEEDRPWQIMKNGQPLPANVKYLGHKFENGMVQLQYLLRLDSGEQVKLAEQPEYFQAESKYPGLERTFFIQENPGKLQVIFKGNANSLANQSMLKSEGGELTITNSKEAASKNKNYELVNFDLKLATTGATTLSCQFIDKPMVDNPNKPAWETEENSTVPEGYRLIAKSDCKTCHNTFRKTIGPAYMEVARKYRNTPANVTMLAAKVKKGGTGVWGSQVMNAHPNMDMSDLEKMTAYVLGLDAEEEAKLPPEDKKPDLSKVAMQAASTTVDESKLLPGLSFKAMQFNNALAKLADIKPARAVKNFAGITPVINAYDGDFKGLESYFAMEFTGYINIPETNIYSFRLFSDDGSQLLVNGKKVIDNDGLHGFDAKEASIGLKKGQHEIRVDYFQGKGGKSVALQWSPGATGAYEVIPGTALSHTQDQQHEGIPYALSDERNIPGNGYPLKEVHPSFDLSQARPDLFTPKVGGMDFMSDGRLVISTWDPAGQVYIIENADSGDPSMMKEKVIARGLAEPLGLAIVEDTIYVLQKQELTQLIDHNGDDIIDEYRTFAKDWKVSANFHEFAFGLAYKDGYFYGALATAINPGGASTQPQIPDRGKAIKISRKDGSVEFVAHGLRTPNGIGRGFEDEIFICDNQGDWLPSSKLVHLQKGAWYGSRSVDFDGTANLKEQKPVVWLPQDEIGNSPSTPLGINVGPYKGQMIHAEVTHGGVKRVFVERVNGQMQGCVFRFIQGLEAGVNRLAWSPDGSLYAGGIGSTGNWGHSEKLWYGLQRLKFNDKSTFEMLAVRAKSNGIEIEFTEPLRPGEGWDAKDYLIKQWYYLPTPEYGGPKLDEKALPILSVNVANDRKKVFLELGGMKEDHLIYVQLQNNFVSEMGHGLWTTEAWYTMNTIPKNLAGTKTNASAAAVAANSLTDWEKSQGWKLLFDGKTTTGWRNFKKEGIGSSWQIQDGALMLNPEKKADGEWQVKDGGDIITEGQFENYELQLEWKIAACGNSGIMYNVQETDGYDYVWQTGPEMQVLDNTCHPDARITKHRAGDLYDLIESQYVTVNPAGEWNKIRIIINNGGLEHWQNGYKIVETTMWDDNWKAMIQGSKFREMTGFGKYKNGHISLQDHGDRVWFRNIKIKELNPDS